jgi:hypothetical protein
MMQHRCKATTKSGALCSARTLPGSEWCFVHDPHRIIDIAEARKQGGQAKSNRARAKKAMVDGALSPAELEGLIGITMSAVINGAKEPAVGNAIANLARAAVAVRDAVAVDERLAELERRLTGRSA